MLRTLLICSNATHLALLPAKNDGDENCKVVDFGLIQRLNRPQLEKGKSVSFLLSKVPDFCVLLFPNEMKLSTFCRLCRVELLSPRGPRWFDYRSDSFNQDMQRWLLPKTNLCHSHLQTQPSLALFCELVQDADEECPLSTLSTFCLLCRVELLSPRGPRWFDYRSDSFNQDMQRWLLPQTNLCHSRLQTRPSLALFCEPVQDADEECPLSTLYCEKSCVNLKNCAPST